jgi:hypothetical protein
MECSKCDIRVGDDERVMCTLCKCAYHYTCLKIGKRTFATLSSSKDKKYICPPCKNKDDDSSDQSSQEQGHQQQETPQDQRQSKGQEVSLLSLHTMLKGIDMKLNKLDELETSVKYLSDKFDEFNGRIGRNEKDIAQLKREHCKQENDTTKLDKDVQMLTDRVRELEQINLSRNLEISGIKQLPNENLWSTIKRLGELTGSKTDVKAAVEDVKRVYAKTEKSPGPIIVTFKDTMEREKWIKARYQPNMNNADLFKTSNNDDKKERIYINEHLTVFFKGLLWAAKNKAKECNYKFVWVKNGRIMARKSEETKYIRINNAEDVKKMG